MSLGIDVKIPEWPRFAEERRETDEGLRVKFDTLYNGQRYAAAYYVESVRLSTDRRGRTFLVEDARERCLWRIREAISKLNRDELERLDNGKRPWIDPTKENL